MSAIGKDASITLITAVPGSGKSLRVVWYIREALKAGEQVYVCNLKGLDNTGDMAGWHGFEDPTKWRSLPPGSILIVDEAQHYFPAKSGESPEYIRAMTEIRHAGVRLILVTQHPGLLHSDIRALAGRHEHLYRANGAKTVTVYTANRVIDNVRSDRALAKEDHHQWTFPEELYSRYRSAETHTVKRTIPSKYKRGAVMVAIAACILGYVVWSIGSRIQRDKEHAAEAAPVDAPGGAERGQLQARDAPPRIVIQSPSDYFKAYTPMIPGMPWTMPATVNREVTVQPLVACMMSGAGEDARGRRKPSSCTCMTEQSTFYDMPRIHCEQIARRGPPYNPYKQLTTTWQGQPMQDQGAFAQVAGSSSRGVGTAGFVGAQARYGYIRDAGPGADPGPYAGD